MCSVQRRVAPVQASIVDGQRLGPIALQESDGPPRLPLPRSARRQSHTSTWSAVATPSVCSSCRTDSAHPRHVRRAPRPVHLRSGTPDRAARYRLDDRRQRLCRPAPGSGHWRSAESRVQRCRTGGPWPRTKVPAQVRRVRRAQWFSSAAPPRSTGETAPCSPTPRRDGPPGETAPCSPTQRRDGPPGETALFTNATARRPTRRRARRTGRSKGRCGTVSWCGIRRRAGRASI